MENIVSKGKLQTTVPYFEVFMAFVPLIFTVFCKNVHFLFSCTGKDAWFSVGLLGL